LTAKTLARKIGNLALTKKAHDVILLDVRKLTSTTDFFVVCHGDSDTHVRAIADEIRARLNEKGTGPVRYEGFHASNWIVLDFVDVVAHIFLRDVRKFYNLERLWADGITTELVDEGEHELIVHAEKPKRPSTRKKKTSVK
jgi:ribosome-associated protein